MSDKRNMQEPVRQAMVYWLETAVIGLGLCPFAKPVWQSNKLRIEISTAINEGDLLQDLYDECSLLDRDCRIETSLLVIPCYLQDFDTFNQFLDLGDHLLEIHHWVGQFQIASFHPHYRFAGTRSENRENWTNRSPYPALHILRESSITRAVEAHPSVESIPETNRAKLEELDDCSFRDIFKSIENGK